jgi:hypothetical protein
VRRAKRRPNRAAAAVSPPKVRLARTVARRCDTPPANDFLALLERELNATVVEERSPIQELCDEWRALKAATRRPAPRHAPPLCDNADICGCSGMTARARLSF